MKLVQMQACFSMDRDQHVILSQCVSFMPALQFNWLPYLNTRRVKCAGGLTFSFSFLSIESFCNETRGRSSVRLHLCYAFPYYFIY